MTESPRWERESQEDLRPATPQPPQSQPEPTTEYDVEAMFDDEQEFGEARLDAVRESFGESLATARDSLHSSLAGGREAVSGAAGRVGRWFAGLDRRPDVELAYDGDPIAELAPGSRTVALEGAEPAGMSPSGGQGHRFPTAPLGYNRQAVDLHVEQLETELAQLRAAVDPPVSITDEIERLGEQTASILVVAHDRAHETARDAQARAARTVSDATRGAERIVADAQRRLRELDEETDAVWRERERLLEDVRVVSASLGSLAQDACDRFPAAPEPAAAGAALTLSGRAPEGE